MFLNKKYTADTTNTDSANEPKNQQFRLRNYYTLLSRFCKPKRFKEYKIMIICKKCNIELPDEAKYCYLCGKKISATHEKRPKTRGNGTGTVYKLPNGKYRAVITMGYYMQDGRVCRKTKSKTFDKKKDAVEFLPSLKTYEPPKKVALFTLYEIYIKSMAYNNLSDSQKSKLGYAWKRLEPLHNQNIITMTIDDMQETINAAVHTYYPARDMKVMLSHLYQIAIKREYVQYNKTEYIELPRAEKSKRDAFTAEEIQKIWDAYNSGTEFAGYVLIMIYAGLRYGEIAKIKKENIHLDERYAIGGIKTEAGIDREIAFAKKIMPVVEHFYNSPSKKFMDMYKDTFYDRYHELISTIGIRELPPHCCRHTYFTRLASEGVQPAVITESGGHKDLSTTMQYIHIPLDDKLRAVDLI